MKSYVTVFLIVWFLPSHLSAKSTNFTNANALADKTVNSQLRWSSYEKRLNSEVILKDLIEDYFLAFSNMDIQELARLFANDVTLRDWDIYAEGKQEVLNANKNIFDSVDSISTDLKELYIDGLVATCIIEIRINQDEVLSVIDIIKFNDEMKIIEVSAYKQ